MSRYLYHVAEKPAENIIDGHPIVIEPRVPFEVKPIPGSDSQFIGNFKYVIDEDAIINQVTTQLAYMGVVEIKQTQVKTATGGFTVEFDFKDADARSVAIMAAKENEMLQKYVIEQRTRMQQNLPALPPAGRVMEIINSRDIDLVAQYGINPVGTDAIGKSRARIAERDETLKRLEEAERQNKALGARLERMERLEKALETATAGKESRSK